MHPPPAPSREREGESSRELALRQPPGEQEAGPASAPRTTEPLRELAAHDPERALARATALLAERPLDADLRYLAVSLLLTLDRPEEAERALRELLALDASCALAHFLLAELELRRGDTAAAGRALRAAAREARALGPDAPLPHGDGERAAQLAAAAEARLRALEARRRG
ncbi:MAG: tetratricopeptide repeat protein [Sandaracinaceae bacterium]|nr:tetratricopeptide repeat protein [Sandaracinaceae bacterium]